MDDTTPINNCTIIIIYHYCRKTARRDDAAPGREAPKPGGMYALTANGVD